MAETKVARRIGLAVTAALALACVVTPNDAAATYPGINGVIVFRHLPSDGGEFISTFDLSSGDFSQLVDFPEGSFTPSVSPDGKRVAFASRHDGDFDLYTVKLDGTGLRKLTRTRRYESWPSWSPSGRRLAFIRRVRSDWQVYVKPLNGSRPAHKLTNLPEMTYHVEWSPNGNRIAFISPTRSGVGEIYTVRSDGSGLRRLTQGAAAYALSWSPDGGRIAFSSYRTAGSGISGSTCGVDDTVATCDFDLYILDLSSGIETQLTEGPTYDDDPTWSPDGETIAFVSNRPGSMSRTDVFVIDVASSSIEQLFSTPDHDWGLAWQAER